MICKNCGAQVADGAPFCGACGAAMAPEDVKTVYIGNSFGGGMPPNAPNYPPNAPNYPPNAPNYPPNADFCRTCGSPIAPGSVVCPTCGAPVMAQRPAKKGINPVILIAAAGAAAVVIIALVALVVIGILSDGGTAPAVATAPPATVAPAPTQPPPPPAEKKDYLFNSDTEYITEAYLNTQSRDDVRLILNEIYARHGYIFSTDFYYKYFMTKSWYTPVTTSGEAVEASFNAIETANKNMIVSYEKAHGWR